MLAELNRAVGAFLLRRPVGDGGLRSCLPGLWVYETGAPSPIDSSMLEPAVGMIRQGSKEMTWGAGTEAIRAGESVIVSHDLPVGSRVTEATAVKPYRSLVMTLDVAMLRSVSDEIPGDWRDDEDAQAIESRIADDAFTNALGRYFGLVNEPTGAPVLAPLIKKELHYRILTAPHGRMLRRLLRSDSHASRIGAAISRIRRDYRAELTVPELARVACMSVSSFHAQFKAITGATPLQYQKQLRLIEARELFLYKGRSVSEAAFEVGYESPTQFSREYRTRFGASPRFHLAEQ